MPVNSLPEDKPKIAFHSAMMAIQNFGFFMVSKFYSPKLKKDIPSLTHHSIIRYAPQMYWDIWGATSYNTTCQGTRNSTGMMAMTCFCETFLCVAMAYGGYISDKLLFPLNWVLHLFGGICYIICTITVPLNRWSPEGVACAKLNPVNGDRLSTVYIFHASLFMVYVVGMLSITYFSFIKATCFNKQKLHQAEEKV